MQFPNPDLLYPMNDNNRDEVILIQFDRSYKNLNMSILRNLFQMTADDPSLYKIFPNLKEYLDMDNDMRYNTTVLFNHIDFVHNLSNEKLSKDICQMYVDQLLYPLKLDTLHSTRMESMIREFLKHDFVKKIYIQADKFTREIDDFLAITYRDLINKRVYGVEGTIIEAISDPEFGVTTAFVSDADDIHYIVQTDKSALHDKMILIMDGYQNIEIDGDPKNNKIVYKYQKEFIQLGEERIANIAYMYPHCVIKGR